MASEPGSSQSEYEDRSNRVRSNGGSTDQRAPLAVDLKGIAITCSVCGLINYPATSTCARCDSRLSISDITVQFPMAATASHRSSSPTGPLIGPEQTIITLEAEEGADSEITVMLGDVVTVGRSNPDTGDFQGIDVDLAPFGAAKKGVSRKHMKLTRKNLLVYVTDLGSTNGTLLNGRQIMPFTERILRSGDELQLGQLKLRVKL